MRSTCQLVDEDLFQGVLVCFPRWIIEIALDDQLPGRRSPVRILTLTRSLGIWPGGQVGLMGYGLLPHVRGEEGSCDGSVLNLHGVVSPDRESHVANHSDP
jgi:hypothetical protein